MSRKRTSRVQYNKLVPEDTFLGRYLSYMQPLETAYAYDFWCGAWLISNAIGRDLTVDRPGAPVVLNLYLILTAESGVTRKSTAVRHATNFVRELTNDHLHLVESTSTPEQLKNILWQQSKEYDKSGITISVSELATFLGRERYVEALPALLTDLYDCPEMREGGGTIRDGDRTLKNVYMSFLSASTPSWLLRAVNPDVIEGGFTSRVLFIVSEEPKHLKSWPEPLNDKVRSKLSQDLAFIKSKSREVERISISEGARKTFDRWYKTRQRYSDTFRASFQSREDAHILRLAAILSINDNTWHIQHTHIVAAIKVVTQVREDGASIFEGTGSNSRFIIGIDKIRDKLLAAGINGLPQRELTKHVAQYMNAEHMRAVLDIMHDLGMVDLFEVPAIGRGRPATIWRGTRHLTDGKALDRITQAHSPART